MDGIGEVLADAWISYFQNEKNNQLVDSLLAELTIEQESGNQGEAVLEGKVFVITGTVEHFANRKALQEEIERLGGKATGSVTSKTSYLINNDVTSNSSKIRRQENWEFPSFQKRIS